MRHEPSDDEIELLLAGDGTGELGAALDAIRNQYRDIPAPTPTGALTEFVSAELVSSVAGTRSRSDAAIISLDDAPSRRRAARLTALTGTAIGKALVGASVAAASVTGAHATGVVDIPVLPEAIIIVDDNETATDTLDTQTPATAISESADETNTETDDGTGSSDATPPTAPKPDDGQADDQDSSAVETATVPISDAGAVTVSFDAERILSIDASSANGWAAAVAVDSDGDSASVDFIGPDDATIVAELEVTDDGLRIRIQDSRDGTTDDIEIERPEDEESGDDTDENDEDPDEDEDTDENDEDENDEDEESGDDTDENDEDSDEDEDTDENDEDENDEDEESGDDTDENDEDSDEDDPDEDEPSAP